MSTKSSLKASKTTSQKKSRNNRSKTIRITKTTKTQKRKTTTLKCKRISTVSLKTKSKISRRMMIKRKMRIRRTTNLIRSMICLTTSSGTRTWKTWSRRRTSTEKTRIKKNLRRLTLAIGSWTSKISCSRRSQSWLKAIMISRGNKSLGSSRNKKNRSSSRKSQKLSETKKSKMTKCPTEKNLPKKLTPMKFPSIEMNLWKTIKKAGGLRKRPKRLLMTNRWKMPSPTRKRNKKT